MRTLRKTLLWLMAIVVVVAGATGWVGYHYWSNADRILHETVARQLNEWYPELKFQLGRFRLDWSGQIHVEQFSLTLPDSERPLIDLPDTIVDLDRDALINRQEPVILRLRLLRPQIEATRLPDGTWDFQKLPTLPESNKRQSLPACDLENAQLVLHIQQSGDTRPATVIVDNANLKLTPNGKRSLLLEGDALIQRIGRLKIDGRINVDTKTGSLTGTLAGVQVGNDLLQYAASFQPSVTEKVAAVKQRLLDEMLKHPDPKASLPFSIAGLADQPATTFPEIRQATLSNTRVGVLQTSGSGGQRVRGHDIPPRMVGASNSILGLIANLDVSFRLAIPEAGSTPDLRLLMDINGGQITNTALPFPLDNLNGQVEYGARSLTIRKLTADNGPTEVNISGTLLDSAAGPSGQLNLKIKNLICDERLRSRLSIGFGKIYDIHHLEGLLDMNVSIVSAPGGKWTPQGLLVRANRASVMHDTFPYPIHDATGTIVQDGRDLRIDMEGRVGDRPIAIKGFVRNPGPDAWVVFEIDVEDFPLDGSFYNACNPKLQHVLDSINLGGLVDAHCRLERKPGPDHRMSPSLVGFLKAGTMAFQKFPYRIENLIGKVEFDGRDWSFKELRGTHDSAQLSADGSYTTSTGTGDLQLTVTTEEAQIDESLRTVLPSHLQRLWSEFSPGGTIRRLVTEVRMLQGEPISIALPDIQIENGRSTMRMFPYELTGIKARYGYRDGLLTIHSFDGRHGETSIKTEGTVQTQPNGDWRATLSKWSANKLRTDTSFNRALSPGLKSVFAAFGAEQILNLAGYLELRGTPDPQYPITAAWEIATDLDRGHVNAGLDLTDVSGRIISTGTWDGYEADVEGILDISSLKVFQKYVLHDVRGPFSLKNGIFSVGSREIVSPNKSDRTVDSSEQINAKFVGGVLTINAQATTAAPTEYVARVNLSHGQLKRFAELYMTSRDRLEGVMNGWVTVNGKGSQSKNLTGRGQLQISPAALYQMPIVFQVMNTLTAAPQDNSFFEYGRVDFQIANEQFNFSSIDLVGSPMQLHGTGRAGFDDSLNLRFVSMLPNSRTGKPQVWIPIVSEVAGLVGGVTNLVGVVVEVNGTTTDPRTRVIPAKNLDNALKQFVRSLRPLPLTPPSPPSFPPLAFPTQRSRPQ
ncbi:MAG: hypothetical protein O3B13_15155 [Planctomycetota bacterium]|nr:hypothetical protein [Planctomycetota bacterium]